MCIEHTHSPFGRQATMGTEVGSMFVAGVLVAKKWLVAPESKMAHCLMFFVSISIFLRRIEAARA
jgi:hypothetical protein